MSPEVNPNNLGLSDSQQEHIIGRLIIDDTAWGWLKDSINEGFLEGKVIRSRLSSIESALSLGFLHEQGLLAVTGEGAVPTEIGKAIFQELNQETLENQQNSA